MPRTLHGTEAGARLCNAIRKMLERHEHQVNRQRQQSLTEQPTSLEYSVVDSNKDRRITVDAPWHLGQVGKDHRKTRSADHGRPDRDSFAFGNASADPASDQSRAQALPFQSAEKGDPDSSVIDNLKFPSKEYDLPQTAPLPSSDIIAVPKLRKSQANHGALPGMVPSILVPRQTLETQQRRLVQITVNDVFYRVVDLTGLTDGVSIKQRLSLAVDIHNPSFYITEWVLTSC